MSDETTNIWTGRMQRMLRATAEMPLRLGHMRWMLFGGQTPIIETVNGSNIADKHIIANYIQAKCAVLKAVGYVSVAEAWMREQRPGRSAIPVRLSEDRKEIIMCCASWYDAADDIQSKAIIQEIVRHEGGAFSFTPIEEMSNPIGWTLELLPATRKVSDKMMPLYRDLIEATEKLMSK